jgi:hypothetical protein
MHISNQQWGRPAGRLLYYLEGKKKKFKKKEKKEKKREEVAGLVAI